MAVSPWCGNPTPLLRGHPFLSLPADSFPVMSCVPIDGELRILLTRLASEQVPASEIPTDLLDQLRTWGWVIRSGTARIDWYRLLPRWSDEAGAARLIASATHNAGSRMTPDDPGGSGWRDYERFHRGSFLCST